MLLTLFNTQRSPLRFKTCGVMKAFTRTTYGGPEALRLEEVQKPSLKKATSW